MRYVTTIGDHEYLVDILDDKHIAVNGATYEIDLKSIGDQPLYSLLVNGESFEGYVYPSDQSWQVLLRGRTYPASVEDERERRLRLAASGVVSERVEFTLKALMPGLIVAVNVREEQEVEKGEVLVVLESMKMQNELKSPRPGIISRLRVKVGDSVEQQQSLLCVV